MSIGRVAVDVDIDTFSGSQTALLALTGSDEANVMACLLAEDLGLGDPWASLREALPAGDDRQAIAS